ncbi:piggyBac transposable element-derived protein 4-like [Condylostylus longicornis]|uniref:piggyBac transposable element-derived protein 4-like n=1 Tax=Condylostylus longicornis TaxID=2530218 RepID=UPI00244DBE61|nr:piggyBac transposable element-derived protein 4-like [Condylostylus longicornis]
MHLNNQVLEPKKTHPDYDKLYKVRPFIKTLSETFTKYYKPKKNISIDESMIRFKGRSCLRQYMPKKPIKWGYKIWVRADEQGYVDEFQIYTGKIGNFVEKELGPRVITDLTRSLVGKNYQIYFDNYFTSISLLRKLKKENIYACGTIRKGRKNMQIDFKSNKIFKRGEYDCRATDDGLTCVKWMHKRIVFFASNFHNQNSVVYVNRKNKDGTVEELQCPKLVKDYTKHMGYVDKADMLKSVYEIDRKSKKWWHRIFFVDVSVVNSHIIYKSRCEGNTMDLKIFCLAIVGGLLGARSETRTRYQNENLKMGPVDVRIEMKSSAAIPDKTTAYCLMLQDRLVEFTPLTGEVNKIV